MAEIERYKMGLTDNAGGIAPKLEPCSKGYLIKYEVFQATLTTELERLADKFERRASISPEPRAWQHGGHLLRKRAAEYRQEDSDHGA